MTTTLAPGLYDESNNLVASWETLVNTYGMDVEKDYTGATDAASPRDVLANNNDLSSGVKMVIGTTITKIGNFAFIDSTGLISIIIPNSVISIGNFAFSGCTGLVSVTMGIGVTSIGNGAFQACGNLDSFAIPNNVTSIGSLAFNNCAKITSVDIPDGVTSLKQSTFSNCTSLKTVTIPGSIVDIGQAAFSNCTSLSDVYYDGSQEEWAAITIGGLNTFLTSANIHYQSESPALTIKYGDEELATLSDGQTARLRCSGKKAATDISIKFGTIGSIAYDGVTTIVSNGQTATMACRGKKLLSDVVILPHLAVSGVWKFNDSMVMVDGIKTGYKQYANYYLNDSNIPYTHFHFQVFDSYSAVYFMGEHDTNNTLNSSNGGYDDEPSRWDAMFEKIDFGAEPQAVDELFYNWLIANATRQ